MTVATPTFKDAQWLLDHAGRESMVVSCYADTSPSGVRPLWREYLKNEVKRIDATFSDNLAAIDVFHRNVAAIEDVLASRRASARALAVFAAYQRNLLQVYTLTSTVPNQLVVDEEPYLVPLLELLYRQRRYLVVHTDTHRGRLYTAVPGELRMIEEIEEAVPKQHRAAGELWGKRQATIARHRDSRIAHYFKSLADRIVRAWPEESYDGIVLFGEHQVLERFRRHLPKALWPSIVGEAPHAWAGRQLPLTAKLESIQAQSLHEHERRIFDEVERRLAEQHHIVTGPQSVIDAIESDQIGYSGAIVMESDSGEIGSRCTACRRLIACAVTECPSCHGRCEKTNLWQAIALLAATKHVAVHLVDRGHGLDRYGRMVALLAREFPPALREIQP